MQKCGPWETEGNQYKAGESKGVVLHLITGYPKKGEKAKARSPLKTTQNKTTTQHPWETASLSYPGWVSSPRSLSSQPCGELLPKPRPGVVLWVCVSTRLCLTHWVLLAPWGPAEAKADGVTKSVYGNTAAHQQTKNSPDPEESCPSHGQQLDLRLSAMALGVA